MVSPENIHMCNVIQTEQVVFMYLEIHTYTHTHSENRGHGFEREQEEDVCEGLEGGNNIISIIISKNKKDTCKAGTSGMCLFKIIPF